MDDSCAVCADTLEWVAYGPCGHREVCSTCVARLRFICDDQRCCICKSDCGRVFVTKAMGDYTRMVNDFSKLPSQVKEGQVGSYWYHEDTQSFFDDAEQYKMIRAMCRLSCSLCDKEEQQPQQGAAAAAGPGGYRKRQRFRNIGQLKSHLSHQHRLFMCDLCLEGRKVFICEQKLYTRAQLNQHKRTGDSEVDGTESERGGFAGHPMCEFCRTSFYGENELYSHMSTEHYTCHICQRQHPGQYDYFKDYDDLETHFRHDHFLCEDEACLTKKFIVFQSEAEIKRHNAMEHGGRMSRSKRNAVLQIPTSFRYRSSNEAGHQRGRRRSFRRESSPDNELSRAIEASLDRTNASDSVAGSSASSSAEPLVRAGTELSDIDPLVQPFDSLSTTDSEPSSRYRQAVSLTSADASLGVSSFPPLSTAPSSSQQKSHESHDTMAARLRRKNNTNVLNVAQPRLVNGRGPGSASSSAWPAPALTPAPVPVLSSGSSQVKPGNGSGSSSYASSLHGRPVTESGLAVGGSWGSRSLGSGNRLSHSNSAPNLIESKSFDPVFDFPPVSAAQSSRLQSTAQRPQAKKTEDVQTSNKSLVERMRAALDYDENKYNAFKEISQEYRQGFIDTWEYIQYVKQFDLTHLIPDMARLCPDIRKQKELFEAYNAIYQSNGSQETFWGNDNLQLKGSSSSRKDKGKKVNDAQNSRSKETLADSIISTVKTLQTQFKPSEGEAEVLEKDGYRPSRGKSTVTVTGMPVVMRGNIQPPAQGARSTAGHTSVDGGSKQKKKSSKFHRIRLGDDYSTAAIDVNNSSTDPSTEGSSAHSVWCNGAGQRLFAK
ncbi:E3 ubiquitin-protein ligase ZNF598-like [Chenopodium quinoa]|uniref:E3 ubiquitin-protein ligase ZNF598-like n=1 Tax=Chenopodium quinoa TaxID=63459 RepID=UPI000B796853|nr:E3 ubiquitin-protein ligase ZNF598-like [Chenopodium quinoa]